MECVSSGITSTISIKGKCMQNVKRERGEQREVASMFNGMYECTSVSFMITYIPNDRLKLSLKVLRYNHSLHIVSLFCWHFSMYNWYIFATDKSGLRYFLCGLSLRECDWYRGKLWMCALIKARSSSLVLFPGVCRPLSSVCGEPPVLICALITRSSRPLEIPCMEMNADLHTCSDIAPFLTKNSLEYFRLDDGALVYSFWFSAPLHIHRCMHFERWSLLFPRIQWIISFSVLLESCRNTGAYTYRVLCSFAWHWPEVRERVWRMCEHVMLIILSRRAHAHEV